MIRGDAVLILPGPRGLTQSLTRVLESATDGSAQHRKRGSKSSGLSDGKIGQKSEGMRLFSAVAKQSLQSSWM